MKTAGHDTMVAVVTALLSGCARWMPVPEPTPEPVVEEPPEAKAFRERLEAKRVQGGEDERRRRDEAVREHIDAMKREQGYEAAAPKVNPYFDKRCADWLDGTWKAAKASSLGEQVEFHIAFNMAKQLSLQWGDNWTESRKSRVSECFMENQVMTVTWSTPTESRFLIIKMVNESYGEIYEGYDGKKIAAIVRVK